MIFRVMININHNPIMTIQALPPDMIIEVCRHLNVSDINSLYYTSLSLQNSIKDNAEYIYSACQHNNPHGLIRTWWDNEHNIPKSFMQCIDGKIHGEYKLWYKDGQLSDHYNFLNDKADGEHISWHENGKIDIHCFFSNGFINGEYKELYENGEMKEHCFFSNGFLNGQYKCWSSNGELSCCRFYMNGSLLLV